MGYRLGIDVGGTFTDLTLLSDDGRMHVFKTPSRPADIAEGCLDAVRSLLAQSHIAPGDIAYWGHGSTVATNAVVERKGARTALLTTDGFRDVLEIRRQLKPDRYDLHQLKPEPLVPRELRFEVGERTLWDGTVHRALEQSHLEELVDRLRGLEIEAIAICLLHAYANPAHETRLRTFLQPRLPKAYISASHEVLPEFREYPRFATTVTNAYVGPVMERYLERFDLGGRELGIRTPLSIFQSNGGIVSASAAARLPVRVLYSGPAAGVQGAMHVAHAAGYPSVITFDMGGTSCDVCLVDDGRALLTDERELGGFPVRTAMIDVHSIGAGGGSVAWIDHGGFLRVGPESAGAEPGPACYGRGGDQATVTDANLVLGRLNPTTLLGGRLKIHADRAHQALSSLAGQLDMPVERAALGILDVVNSHMIGAIRVVTVERGYDYRNFALMAFGGAGPLHAAEVAQEMGIKTVLIPSVPGLLCALGLLLADYRNDFTQTRITAATSQHWNNIHETFVALENQARAWAARHQLPSAEPDFLRSVQMRYVGQSYHLLVQTPMISDASDIERLLQSFHRAHTRLYGYAQPHASAEIVDFRVTLTIPVPRPSGPLSWPWVQKGGIKEAYQGERLIWFKEQRQPMGAPVYRRELLPAGCSLRGPAVVEQLDSTTLLPPEMEAVVDDNGTIRVTL